MHLNEKNKLIIYWKFKLKEKTIVNCAIFISNKLDFIALGTQNGLILLVSLKNFQV